MEEEELRRRAQQRAERAREREEAARERQRLAEVEASQAPNAHVADVHRQEAATHGRAAELHRETAERQAAHGREHEPSDRGGDE
jgi:hypothetical protein